MIVTAGSTNVSAYFYIVQDASGANPGEPVTGLLFSDIETGGSASYARQGAARVDLTLVTLASASAAHTDGGFILVDDTNMPGLYRCDYPDAAFVTGVDEAFLSLVIESSNNAVVAPLRVELTDFDLRNSALQTDWEDAGRLDVILDSRMAEASIDTTGGVVDHVTLVDTSTNVTNLSAGSAAISAKPSAFVNIAGGTETNDFNEAKVLDGTTHSIAPSGGETDGYYEFIIGGNSAPVEVTWHGYANSNGDAYLVFGYNYTTTTYEQVGGISASNSTTVSPEVFNYPGDLVGTGGDSGLVRFRIQSSDGANISTDRVLCSYTVVDKSSGYQGGAVWFDSNSGNTGVELNVDGTISNPVGSESSARTIANSANLSIIHCKPGSTFTLDQDYEFFEFKGFNYVLDLNGKNFNGSSADLAVVLGNDSGANPNFTVYKSCQMMAGVRGKHVLIDSAVAGRTTLAEAGDYSWANTRESATAPATIDFNSLLDASTVIVSAHANELTAENMGVGLGTYTLVLSGMGSLIIDASCLGGNISISGAWGITDNSGGAVTITRDDVAQGVITIEDEAFDPTTDDVATVTTLTNLPSIPNNWITAAGVSANALDGKGDWNVGKTGYTLSQAFPSNFDSLVITPGGAVDTLVQGFLNSLIAETTGGRVANNFDTFFDNADADTTKVVDDVGTDWSASEREEIRGRLGVTGTTSAGGNTPTLSTFDESTDKVTLAATTHTGATIPVVTTVDTTTNNTDMRGTDGANTVAPDNAGIAGIQADLDNGTDGLGAIKAAVDALPATAAIADAVLDELLSGHTTAGTLGKAISDILADTNELQLDDIPGLIGALNNLSQAQTLTKVNEALDTAIPELGVGVPSATPSLRTATMLQHMKLRNKLNTQTSGTDALELYNDAGTLITKKLLTDDGSDYSEEQMS